MYVNCTSYKQQLQPFGHLFRRWGNSHLDWPRYGIPLCNLTGRLDDKVDPSCWPLDKWWEAHPDKIYWDHDFNKPTPLLDLPVFDSIQRIKPFMIRSNLLKWDTTGQFVPHVDMVPELITHVRLWGTTETPDNYSLKCEGLREWDFEPGRLYLIDTLSQHSAEALVDDAHTFFITLTLESTPTIRDLLL